MEVQLFNNPKSKHGLAVQFPYRYEDVETIRNVLGLSWDKAAKLWCSQGPEVLLDMERFGVNVTWLNSEAKNIAEEFRQQLWNSLDARSESIDEVLYGYQKQGTKFLTALERAILADEPGLGKTKQALDALVQLENQRVLIISPKTITFNWIEEINKWHPELKAGVVPDITSGDKHLTRKKFWDNMPQVVITNPEKLILKDWPNDIDWDIVIPDDIRLKNQSTATWKAVNKIAKRAKRVWILNGTPLEIKLQELYSIFSLLRPAVFGNFMRFRDQHCITDWAGTVVGVKNLDLLRERIGFWMLRRTKEEVLPNLPPKLYNNRYIKLSRIEEKEYEELIMEFDEFLDEHQVGGSTDPMVKTLRMRQYCCSPELLGITRQGSKYEALLDLIEDTEGQMVIFCFFEEMISKLATWLQKDAGYNPEALISGPIKAEERVARINAFNAGKLGKILLSTDAGNRGVNITGASTICHYDQIWNPQSMKQREDRLYRIGQKNTVNVVNLICLDTIDTGMYQLNREREQLFEDVIEGAEASIAKKISPARWRRLVEGKLNGRFD